MQAAGFSPFASAHAHAGLLLIASAITFAALAGLGRVPGRIIDGIAGGSGLLRLPISLATGWAVVALVSAAAAPFGGDQRAIALAFLALGIASLLPWGMWHEGWASEDIRLLRDLAVTVSLAAPLALLVARTPAMMYDEFAQWLPNTRSLVEHGAYWLYPDWIGATLKPSYPNGTSVISLVASQISGPAIESYLKTFMVFATASFGFVLAFVASSARRVGIPPLVTLGVLAALTNPFFDPRIALTSYADAPTGLMLALAGVAAAAGIGAARGGKAAVAGGWFARSGACCTVLVMLRSTNVVLVAALALACGAMTLAAERPARRQALWGALLLGPPIIGWMLWQLYLHVARIGPDLEFRPLATWDWWAPFIVLRAILTDRLRDHPWLGGTALGTAVLALALFLATWRRLRWDRRDRPVPANALLAVVAIVCASFLTFLVITYIGFFSAQDITQAGSTWRYLSELGPLLIAGLVAAVAALVPKLGSRHPAPGAAMAVATLAAVLTLSLPVAARRYYALDCHYPDMVAARLLTAELGGPLARFAPSAVRQRRLAVVHPTMGDWMANAIAYDLGWPTIDHSIQYRTVAGDGRSAEQWAWDGGADALLDLTALDRSVLMRTGVVPDVRLLARPAGREAPWLVVAATTARPLPRCGR